MGIVIRQGIKASVVTYIGAFLGYLIWLQLFIHWLNPEEFGLVKALLDASLLLIPFLQGGAASLIVKFSPYLNNRLQTERQFLGFALALPLVSSLVGMLVILLFREQIFAAYMEKSALFVQYLWAVLPMAFFGVYIQLTEALINVRLRIVVPRIIREWFVRIGNIAAVGLYFLGYIDLMQAVFGFILVHFLQLLFLVLYYGRLRGRWIAPSLGIVKTRYFKPLANYSLFMVLGTGSAGLVAKIDSLMTAALLGLTQTGIYGIAFLIATVIELPRRVFISILTPLVAEAYRQKQFDRLQDYYHRSSLNLGLVAAVLFLGIWSNLDLVYEFIPQRELYEQGRWVVFFVGLAKVFDMGMGINSEILQNSKYYRWNIYLTPALAVLAVTTNYIFIPPYGITGAALATFITVALFNIIRHLMVVYKMKISPFQWQNALMWTLALATFGLTEWLVLENVWLDLMCNVALILAVFIFPVYRFKLSPDLNNILEQGLKRLRR